MFPDQATDLKTRGCVLRLDCRAGAHLPGGASGDSGSVGLGGRLVSEPCACQGGEGGGRHSGVELVSGAVKCPPPKRGPSK